MLFSCWFYENLFGIFYMRKFNAVICTAISPLLFGQSLQKWSKEIDDYYNYTKQIEC